jgi:hypothetical protein
MKQDGMVIKIDDLNLGRDLGFVGKDPRGAIAFQIPCARSDHPIIGYSRDRRADRRINTKRHAGTR